MSIPVWGFLLDRIDVRIAVSEQAKASASRYSPADYEVIPNGVLIPPEADPAGRENRILFVGRQEARKGLSILLRAWPEIRRRTGSTLRVIGADPGRQAPDGEAPHAVRRDRDPRFSASGAADGRAARRQGDGGAFARRRAGMVLTRAFACATPVVASDIEGYREVMTSEAGFSVPPGDPAALADAMTRLLADEQVRCQAGLAARRLAEERYSWDGIAGRLAGVYERSDACRSRRDDLAASSRAHCSHPAGDRSPCAAAVVARPRLGPRRRRLRGRLLALGRRCARPEPRVGARPRRLLERRGPQGDASLATAAVHRTCSRRSRSACLPTPCSGADRRARVGVLAGGRLGARGRPAGCSEPSLRTAC